MSQTSDIQAVLDFWREAGPDRWFRKDEDFDALFRSRFLDLHMAAARRELDGWIDTPDGALALMILLDQFPRNAFRDTAHAFATDPLALTLAREAVERRHHKAVDPALLNFLILPFEHSERLEDQDRYLELAGDDADLRKWGVIHRDIIVRFGRFPHRNPALGRTMTAEEQAFLDAGGFGS